MKNIIPLLIILLASCSGKQNDSGIADSEFTIPIDSIVLSDPFVLADSATQTYYMTGTGGRMWKSKDLRLWAGPYDVVEIDTNSWMGANPMIWAAELHLYKGKYYYFATFTNSADSIGTFKGARLERRASHILVADRPDGPYRPISDKLILPADKLTLDGTLWTDTDGKPYMVYCWEWLQNWNGTIEKIELSPDLSESAGEGKILFRASESPWSREIIDGKEGPNRVTDGPFLFTTESGRLGMLWTSWIYDVYTQGVAYSESGTLDGPWIQQEQPVTPPNYGHGMLFRTFDGHNLMAVHSHDDSRGYYHRQPHFFEVDLSGDSLTIGREYRPAGIDGTSFLDIFPSIEDKIIQLYENEVFYTQKDPNFKMSDICTADFIRRLSDANEYDDTGYATWLLRSGMQDGDDSPSRVLSVTPGVDNTVVVHWSDMGHKGSTTLSMIESDGQWKIDNATVPEGFNPL